MSYFRNRSQGEGSALHATIARERTVASTVEWISARNLPIGSWLEWTRRHFLSQEAKDDKAQCTCAQAMEFHVGRSWSASLASWKTLKKLANFFLFLIVHFFFFFAGFFFISSFFYFFKWSNLFRTWRYEGSCKREVSGYIAVGNVRDTCGEEEKEAADAIDHDDVTFNCASNGLMITYISNDVAKRSALLRSIIQCFYDWNSFPSTSSWWKHDPWSTWRQYFLNSAHNI